MRREILDLEMGRADLSGRLYPGYRGVGGLPVARDLAGHGIPLDSLTVERHGSMRDCFAALGLSLLSGLGFAWQLLQGAVSVGVGIAAIASAWVMWRRYTWDRAERKRRGLPL